MGNSLSLAVAIGVPLAGGIAGGFLSQKDVKEWYPTLKKPTWNPPSWLFGPVWTVLYASMGAASWIVFKQGGRPAVPLVLYGLQLALNLAWQPLFFKAKKLDVALADSTAMVGMAAIATVSMSRSAGASKIAPLMVPYLAWISFATALNYKVLELNPETGKTALPEALEGAAAKAEAVKAEVEAKAEEVAEQAAEAVGGAEAAASEAAEQVKEEVEEAVKKVEEAVAPPS